MGHVAGAVWVPDSKPKGGGRFLAVDNKGEIHGASGETELPFIILWQTDGSNPGTPTARLAAAGASMSLAQPIFPPGTVTVGDRHFLYVPSPVSWTKAVDMAKAAGGHLMVVSAKEESRFLQKLTAELHEPDGIWLGGSLDADHWNWITGESWISADWADVADDGSDGYAFIVSPGKGWDSKDREEDASGFIIEWSDDGKSVKTQEAATATPSSEAEVLWVKAKEVVLAAETKRSEALAENIKKFNWDLDSFIRGQNSTGQSTWGSEVDKLKTCVEDDRILVDKVKQQGIQISPEMLKIAEFGIKKQEEIEARFGQTASVIRDAFVGKMTVIRDTAIQSGQTKAAESANETIHSAEDLQNWLDSFEE